MENSLFETKYETFADNLNAQWQSFGLAERRQLPAIIINKSHMD